ncbi:MAG: Rrf2 family transcriptional regulator [Planctomycetes bacterium]|nr:Rrf2 family transcriptional regulator [Planctomycetota bacterium]
MAHYPQGKIFRLHAVARKTDVPTVFLHKIFQKLVKLGILDSHRGAAGGFSFAKSPAKITAKRVIEMIQGPLLFNQCLDKKKKCNRSAICSIKKKLCALQDKITNDLAKLTLKNLAREEKRK